MKRHTPSSTSRNNFGDNECLFRFPSIKTTCKKYPEILAQQHWLTALIKKPNLAFPFGDSLVTATKKNEFLKQLWCTFHYSQSLHPKQLEEQVRTWKDILKELCDQTPPKKGYPSLLVLCPNMGPTSFTYFHDLYKSMNSSLIREGFILWTFNPAAVKCRNYRKLKSQPSFPPVPFIIVRKLVKDDFNYFKERNMEIPFHVNFELQPGR